MTPRERLITVNEKDGTTPVEAKALLNKHKLERILVVNDAFELKGLITVKDITKQTTFPNAARDSAGRLRVAAAVSVGEGTEQRVELLVKAGVDALVVDTAHGHSKGVIDRVRWVKQNYPQVDVAGGNVAADDIDLRVVLLDPAHAVDHALAVAVGRVHHQCIDAGLDQQLHALLGALAHAHGGGHAQAACAVTRCVGEGGLLGDVLDGDKALEFKGVVHDQDALELVLVEQGLGFHGRGAVLLVDGDQALARRHDLADLDVVAGLEAQVAAGDDAHHLAAVAHGKAGDAEVLGQLQHLQHGVLGGDDHGVVHHAGFVALDLGHFGSLLLCRHVLVNDADTALLRNGNGQTRFGHGVHGGGHKGDVQGDVARKARLERGVLGQDLGESGDQEDVVEGQGFTEKAHVRAPKEGLYPCAGSQCML